MNDSHAGPGVVAWLVVSVSVVQYSGGRVWVEGEEIIVNVYGISVKAVTLQDEQNDDASERCLRNERAAL